MGLAKAGHNDELHPMYFTASLLKLFLSESYPAFTPDIVVHQRVGLARWGIDGEAIAMPGHTAGSIVVLMSDHSAFVGDMILGGSWGGAFDPESPGEHYFHADPEQNRKNIAELVRRGVEKFYLGHGGPVRRADVIEAFGLKEQSTPEAARAPDRPSETRW